MDAHRPVVYLRGALPDDAWAVEAIWRPEERWLGSGKLAWKRYWANRSDREHWLLASVRHTGDVMGFVHYRIRRDGGKTIYEIAVAKEARRMGIATALLDAVGVPVRLKTNAGNRESNAFYRASGFRLMGVTLTKKGKPMNVWEKG